ncbi:MAG: RNA-binding protein [candidate division NC10 bacterium]|jgi:RNA recognition motif-containing protein|nr:RNA-binding protein [candidate division NC10 bacterium]MCH7895598.1 RNA-binding protein [candidate division NC10 bacterium]MCZ6551227.1 RNA-binding protein [candidate division NC10 bacterium]
MGSRIYVGNLPFSVDADQLRSLFEEGGRQVQDVKIVTDRITGRPRGFAFVDMDSSEEAEAAITALNGRDMGGRTLTVSMAREREPRHGGGDRRDRY